MKAVLAANCLHMYADLNQPLTIEYDVSDHQLDLTLYKMVDQLAHLTKTLSPAQKNYTTTEKELLAIILTLKEYM